MTQGTTRGGGFKKPGLSRKEMRLIGAAADILADPPGRIDYLHSLHCQCGLPYRNPGEHVREWDRRQGNASLRIEAGAALDPGTGEFVKLGLPYGEKPRLVLIHLCSEAIRTASPVVNVEDSMTAFARSLGVDTSGPGLTSLKDQLGRLAAATVRFGVVADERAMQVNTSFIRAMELWYPATANQRVLWPSTIQLAPDYFHSLKLHAVPLDRRAIAALSSSSMALDVYVWMSQRLHRIPAKKPQFLGWATLQEQFGPGFKRTVDFRRKFLGVLRQVQAVYPQAVLEADSRGLTLKQSRPPVLRTRAGVPATWGEIHG